MARKRKELAFACDVNKETALHLLAQDQWPLDSSCHCPEHQSHCPEDQKPIMINPGKSLQSLFFRRIN